MSFTALFKTLAATAVVCGASLALAQNPPPAAGGAKHPCEQIKQACLSAGFKAGDWKKGDGLWRDCIDPVIQGQTSVPGGTKSLPAVDAGTVAACKAKNPKFGEGKVGSK